MNKYLLFLFKYEEYKNWNFGIEKGIFEYILISCNL